MPSWNFHKRLHYLFLGCFCVREQNPFLFKHTFNRFLALGVELNLWYTQDLQGPALAGGCSNLTSFFLPHSCSYVVQYTLVWITLCKYITWAFLHRASVYSSLCFQSFPTWPFIFLPELTYLYSPFRSQLEQTFLKEFFPEHPSFPSSLPPSRIGSFVICRHRTIFFWFRILFSGLLMRHSFM